MLARADRSAPRSSHVGSPRRICLTAQDALARRPFRGARRPGRDPHPSGPARPRRTPISSPRPGRSAPMRSAHPRGLAARRPRCPQLLHGPHHRAGAALVDETRCDPGDDQRQQQDVARAASAGRRAAGARRGRARRSRCSHAAPDHRSWTSGGVEQRRERGRERRGDRCLRSTMRAPAGSGSLRASTCRAPRLPAAIARALETAGEEAAPSRGIAQLSAARPLRTRAALCAAAIRVRATSCGGKLATDKDVYQQSPVIMTKAIARKMEQRRRQAEHAREPPGRGAARVAVGHARAHPPLRRGPSGGDPSPPARGPQDSIRGGQVSSTAPRTGSSDPVMPRASRPLARASADGTFRSPALRFPCRSRGPSATRQPRPSPPWARRRLGSVVPREAGRVQHLDAAVQRARLGLVQADAALRIA